MRKVKFLNKDEDIREMSIALDSWDDIFSDFDPRVYAERAISEDFINELKKRYKENRKGRFLIFLYIPIAFKDEKIEKIVLHRLEEHFKKSVNKVQNKILKMRLTGIIYVSLGIFFLAALTFSIYFKFIHEIVIKILDIIFMPLGWFGVWEGLSKIVDAVPKFNLQKKLFQKLSAAEYKFHYY